MKCRRRGTKVWSDRHNQWFASKYEVDVADILSDLNFSWAYEPIEFESKVRIAGQKCLDCGAPLYKIEKYTPDFVIHKVYFGEYFIEVKGGTFNDKVQARIRRFRQQHRRTNYLIVFRNDIRLKNTAKKLKVSEWGEKHGITVIIGTEALWRYLR